MPGWEEEDHQKAMTAQHDIHCSHSQHRGTEHAADRPQSRREALP